MINLKQLRDQLKELRRTYESLPEKERSREWSKPNGLWDQIRNLECYITQEEEMIYFAAMGIETFDLCPKKII